MSTSAKGKTLVIVESPAKAKTIEKYLGKDYIVRASVGHIRDIPKSNKCRICGKLAIDIAGGYTPHYEVTLGKEKIIAELRSLAKGAKEVLLATDPDREGEAIAWHIVETLGLKKAKRIVFYEITEGAVQEAAKNPRPIDENLRHAQEARRGLDRLVGYALSGLIWKKVRYGLGAGRVQSPALRILMEREREWRAFVPEVYWRIYAKVESKKKESFELLCTEEPRDKKVVERIIVEGKKYPWQVRDVKETETTRSPRPPFTTSTLQQAASNRFGMSPSSTMRAAQKLYEAGLITYMRTDSTNLSAQAVEQIAGVIEKTYGKASVQVRTYKTKSKNAQEAHEAVRPTNATKRSAGHNPEQIRLYKLIWQRTVASQMVDAVMLRTKIVANILEAKEPIPDFSANGSRMLSLGWLAADPEAKGEEVLLPKVEVGETLSLHDLYSEERETEPPFRYTEAGLVKELEKRGIGRPSTYASIIKTLLDQHGYVTREGKTLIPTDTGDVVSSFLEEHFAFYISDTFTAEMEEKLDDIANGTREYAATLQQIYGPFSKEIKAKEKVKKITNLGDADPEMKCPKCESKMVVKLSKNGKFLSCARFPECDGARTFDGKELAGPRPTGEKCPECATGELVEREGRFGKFIACGKYPKCKYIKNDPETAKLNSTGVKCNLCADGEMVTRRGRFGFFYSCSNYPNCKNITKAKPTGNNCPLCKSLMMEGTKTIPERCSNRACPNHNPHKLNTK
ncbi:MAG: DNA topoisomerase I [Candidatus Lloydbacteria bacterium RIFCSPHIGHO2_02_FULL_54_17]|uniref:DNA topoisomerase 1 n=1 Tax=Candidatus Lloydbacteria bacterium RIFCSPHIGHO2_02_FULL_54_17 TaxID=1798664 RepID=A0A1G2DFR6_9BACT|nr:MAG: DNA topoisomerase I [Candidatus Lloydbacteria bacterium RIFCSPHIGHO2_01_FULL_54_11]OGZ12449.1 MAG: DNA topoisomerase I [Candidatus Lloydbacteria bacterium RIFCSPHIGHO2_02_FULL_54_17]OGZ14708.1 MAG: DNA topoisomerase I [Candidatus Lloydbacteria bacterium RIFCSPLOWO2_01_FULL_54_18]OGZ16735.1 MAG: DNA topoisomerase I [Candidatus Lloydbacteria bacterium RIFCSPLOWO2_02_FULL_54_12]